EIGPDFGVFEPSKSSDTPDMLGRDTSGFPVEDGRASDGESITGRSATTELVDCETRSGDDLVTYRMSMAHATKYRKSAHPGKAKIMPSAGGGDGDPPGRVMERPILSQADFHTLAAFRFRKIIEKLKMSQAEAARIMGISRGVLRNWLAGDNAIQTYQLYIFSRATGVTFDFVFLDDSSNLPDALREQMDVELQANLARLLGPENPEPGKRKDDAPRRRKD
ncbi:MAG: hypothetical protein JWP57_4369, partial [Spirosoma sp.]|nr:hypothetical protein [Spirosoma sp.]